MGYKVKLDIFEGPFDLLVYLIEHARMSIYDIKVSEITAQYLEYIDAMKSRDVVVAQDFMVLAAELIELKAKMLLPGVAKTAPEEDADDPRASLVARLLEYKQYKEMAEFFAEQEDAMSHVHTKPKEDLSKYTGQPYELLNVDMAQFAKAFKAFVFKKQKLEEIRKTYERVERQRMTLEHRIEQIKEFFLARRTVRFSELLKEDRSAYNVVITFMSLLELLKQKAVTATQSRRFGDITVSLAVDGPKDGSPEEQ